MIRQNDPSFRLCFLRQWLRLALAAMALAIAAPAVAQIGTAAGQQPRQPSNIQSIAAVVNDEVISVFDLLERMKLVILSTDLEDTPETRQRLLPLVLRSLIDERIDHLEKKKSEKDRGKKAVKIDVE